MIRRPPISTRTATLFPDTTRFRSYSLLAGGQGNEEKVYDYINAFLDDDTAEYLVTEWGYGHANQAAMERIDQETLASMDYDNLEAFRANTLWQAPIQTALREKMIAEFEKIKAGFCPPLPGRRSEENTSELQSAMRTS